MRVEVSQSIPRQTWPVLACLALGLVCAPLLAGPLKPAEVTPEAKAALETPPGEADSNWATQATPGTGRTMELLLEMQKKDPGPAAAPPEAGSAKATVAKPVAAAARSSLPAGLELGTVPPAQATAATMFSVPQEPAIRATAEPSAVWEGGGSRTAYAAPRTPSGGSDEMRRWLRLPAEAVNWLRQNRYQVVTGAILTLVLVWVGGIFLKRGRYR